jgi:hypothetical protein
MDHKDGDTRNNKIGNLREVNRFQNGMNRKIDKRNKFEVAGVYYEKRRQTWRASICVNGSPVSLGTFKMFDDAVAARRAAEDKYQGEFAARHSRPQVTYSGPDLFA